MRAAHWITHYNNPFKIPHSYPLQGAVVYEHDAYPLSEVQYLPTLFRSNFSPRVASELHLDLKILRKSTFEDPQNTETKMKSQREVGLRHHVFYLRAWGP